MSERELPAWPDKPHIGSPASWEEYGGAFYQKRRADAALARLRVAVEALRAQCIHSCDLPPASVHEKCAVCSALSSIGPLPDEPK